MVISENELQTLFGKATKAVKEATETVQTTTKSVASAVEDNRRPGGALDQLSRVTREAPLRWLAIAFALGLIIARRQ
jgi:hypothetical protein